VPAQPQYGSATGTPPSQPDYGTTPARRYPAMPSMGGFPSWPTQPGISPFGGYGYGEQPTSTGAMPGAAPTEGQVQEPAYGRGTASADPAAGTPWAGGAPAPEQMPAGSGTGMSSGGRQPGYGSMPPFGMPPWMMGPRGFGGPWGGDRIEVGQSDAGYEIYVDLRGNRPEDVKLHSDRGHLNISIARGRDWGDRYSQPGASSYGFSRSYSSASRRMPLPRDADLMNVTRRVEGDRLIITIPRSDAGGQG
jgi:hypothetical protein